MEIIKYQLGIVEKLPLSALYMMFNIKKNSIVSFGLKILQRFVDGKSVVAGFCNNLLKMFKIPENESFKRTKFNNPIMSD
ncbi:peroxidase, partial [Francisella tularensis subsp. holarctica]|nr:peroxidase [Francisella tularensis subsp. holarctica]